MKDQPTSTRRTSTRILAVPADLLQLAVVVLLGAVQPALANPPSVPREFESQALDLDSGSVYSADDEVAESSVPPALTAEEWSDIRSLVRQDSYRVQTARGPVTAINAAHGLRASFDRNGVRIVPLSESQPAWEWRLAAVAYGYAGEVRKVRRAAPVAEGNRVEYRRGELVEWFVNDARGLEQGFTLASPPEGGGAGPLVVRLAPSGSLVPRGDGDGSEVAFVDAGGAVRLRYGGLVAWDAGGRRLAARMAVEGGGLRLEVDDRGADYPMTIDPTILNEDAKLLASDGAPGDQFGAAVAVSGDTVVVGASQDDDLGTDSGSAYVFVRSGTTWTQQAKLLASDGANEHWFGQSVAVSGDTVVVGTYNYGAYVFVRSGTTWIQQAKLPTFIIINNFGFSVAVSGDTVVVGAPGGISGGSAYVFVRGGTTWTQQARLLASDVAFGDFFGRLVAVSGDTVMVGVFQDDDLGTDSGSAYVFVRSGTIWTEQAKLLAGDGAAFDFFGASVAVSGDTAVVGAYGDDVSGSAYVFVRGGATWTQEAKLLASGGAFGGGFGYSVAVSSETVVVGTYNYGAFVFLRSGTNWTEQARLLASDGPGFERFGQSVAVSGDTVVVGASLDDDRGNDSGSAYVFLNFPPIAEAGDDEGAECTGPSGAFVALDGSGSTDPDSTPGTHDDIVSFEWFDAFGQPTETLLGEGEILEVTLALGAHVITLRVTDRFGATDTDEVTKTVVDTVLPAVAVALQPDTFWPPNHRMVDVTAAVVAADLCSTPVVLLASIVSDESDDAPGSGDGRTVDDVQDAQADTPDYDFRLRAERDGAGDGRTYTATYMATDGAGNASSAEAAVIVPHDRSGSVDPLHVAVESGPSGTIASWGPVEGASRYHVVRGSLERIVETESVIDVGDVVCIERGSLDEDTRGWEDIVAPQPGRVFFYLVEYDDGSRSSYGAASAAKPRIVRSGDCE